MSINYIKQFPKRLEARNDQHTAREAWSDYTVICYLNKLILTCGRKPLPYEDITDLLELQNEKVVQNVFLPFKVVESGHSIEATKSNG